VILPTNGLFRGVEVPRGRSRVIFEYEPRSFLVGSFVSISTLVAAGLLWTRTRPNRSNPT
jgi:uncharacterized membrane protein YfhO